jgi:hypothetical protein
VGLPASSIAGHPHWIGLRLRTNSRSDSLCLQSQHKHRRDDFKHFLSCAALAALRFSGAFCTRHPVLAGFVDHKYGVVLLSSTGTRVGVSNSAGAVTLDTQYEGTDFEPSLKDTSAPAAPIYGNPAKVARALAQTNFGLALGPQILVPGLILIPVLTDDDQPASPYLVLVRWFLVPHLY